MTPETGFRLMALEAEFNAMLDAIHDAFLREMSRQARSFGQLTRIRP